MSHRPVDSRPIGAGPLESKSDLRTVDWWGVVFLLVVLGAFYSAIMFSYFFLRFGSEHWPPIGTDTPDIVLPGIATGALLASCLPLLLLQRRLGEGVLSRMNVLLAASWLLGMAFMAVQVGSFLTLDFGVRDHAYGSAFYTTTVSVMMMLFGGLYVGAIVQARAWKGHFNGPRHVAITNLAVYWYVIVLMWVITFVSLYVLQLFE